MGQGDDKGEEGWPDWDDGLMPPEWHHCLLGTHAPPQNLLAWDLRSSWEFSVGKRWSGHIRTMSAFEIHKSRPFDIINLK